MKVRFTPLARRELDDAFLWYSAQVAGLGQRFLDEIDRAVRLAAAHPLALPEIGPGLRRSLLHRFPYGLIYGLDDLTLVVIAVAHLHRKPSYWIDRV
jgi:plasmid stabilization system protein ParE